MIKVLMVGNTASVGWNFKKGLEKEGHHCDIIFKERPNLEGKRTEGGKLLDYYDIVHIHYPSHRWKLSYCNLGKTVLHWHGSDARKSHRNYFVKQKFRKIAKKSLCSTIDMNWWIPEAERIINPIDTEMFKPMLRRKSGTVIFDNDHKKGIPHNEMPDYMNKFKEAVVYPAQKLSPYLISVTALECASCGLRVRHHPYMTREWVVKNASIESQTEKLLKIYKDVLRGGNI